MRPERPHSQTSLVFAASCEELDPHKIKENRDWLAERKKKYSDADPYYPSFLASYLYPRLEDRMTRVEAKLQAMKVGKAPSSDDD